MGNDAFDVCALLINKVCGMIFPLNVMNAKGTRKIAIGKGFYLAGFSSQNGNSLNGGIP
ncbi:hypothetical protein D3C76_1737570 [compost metagenome]